MSAIIDKIELPTSTIQFDETGILWVIYKDNIEIDLPAAEKHAEACCKLCNNCPTLFIIDTRNKTVSMTPEARKFFANHDGLNKVRKAQAVLVDSLANRLVANFYFRFEKPKHPGKVFSNLTVANNWLSKYK